MDHCFQKAGFDKKRLFYTQGDYGLLQCCEPCHRQTYDNRALILRMVEEQKNMRIPTALIPRCPKCGKPMAVNLRSDDRFAEDEGWRKAAGRYADFLRRHDGMHILLWEIGVGYNTPGIIKYPFWLRSLVNVRAPRPAGGDFLALQDSLLQKITACKGVTAFHSLTPMQKGLYLWRGDITTLQTDGIVNAANSGLTGCYHPCHQCIDNAIHTFSGVQLRLACASIIKAQGRPEPAGQAALHRILLHLYRRISFSPPGSSGNRSQNRKRIFKCLSRAPGRF